MRVFRIAFSTMKADEGADCAGSCEINFRTGLCFFFLSEASKS